MNKLYYCNQCKRVMTSETSCVYCKSEDMRELVIKAPVNVIGTKIKGEILKYNNEKATLIVKDERNNKLLKEYGIEQLRKIL